MYYPPTVKMTPAERYRIDLNRDMERTPALRGSSSNNSQGGGSYHSDEGLVNRSSKLSKVIESGD